MTTSSVTSSFYIPRLFSSSRPEPHFLRRSGGINAKRFVRSSFVSIRAPVQARVHPLALLGTSLRVDPSSPSLTLRLARDDKMKRYRAVIWCRCHFRHCRARGRRARGGSCRPERSEGTTAAPRPFTSFRAAAAAVPRLRIFAGSPACAEKPSRLRCFRDSPRARHARERRTQNASFLSSGDSS